MTSHGLEGDATEAEPAGGETSEDSSKASSRTSVTPQLLLDGREAGRVTSGAPSPSLGKSIGLGYLPPATANPGTSIEIVVRDRGLRARIVETPFVGRP